MNSYLEVCLELEIGYAVHTPFTGLGHVWVSGAL